MRISNFIVFLFLTVLIGCKSNIPTQNFSIESVFVPDTLALHYEYNKIKLPDLFGSWTLQEATFTCEYGIIEHLEKYYEIQDTNKIMRISQNTIDKIIFWREPYYSVGILSLFQSDSINSFSMTPSRGTPKMVVHIDFTDKVLTLICSSTIKLKNSDKIYEGKIIEEYKKRI